MAVTNNATLIEDHETAPTYTSIGGGQGASQESEFYFRGSNSSSRKLSNVTENGYWFSDGTQHDISAGGTHVKMYVNCITPGAFTDFHIRIGDTQTTYERHDIGVAFYDNEAGGWAPVWVEVGAGVDVGGGPGAYTAIDEWAVTCDMSAVGGNLKNFITDQSHYATRPVFLWDGTAGDLDDFITTESTAGVGVLKLVNGVYFCFANFKVGSATATTFTHTNVTVAWPDATWLPTTSTWMGIDIDLQNASTAIDLSSNVFQAANPTGATARKPDFLVTGTSGTLDVSGSQFIGMRIVDFTDKVTATDCTFSSCGAIDATVAGTVGADLSGSSVLVSAVAADASAVTWNVNADPNTYTDGMTFSKGTNAHHAIEFGTSSPLTMTLTNCDFSGFNASDSLNDSTLYFARTSGSVTLNLSGCTGNISVKTAGCTVTKVIDPVTFTAKVTDDSGANIQNARVLVKASSGAGPLPYQDAVTITNSGTTATITGHTAHGMENGDKVLIEGCTSPTYDANNGVFTITYISSSSYSYTMGSAPGSSPTGAPTCTYVALEGLTNASGEVSDSRSFAASQPVTGWARKSSAAPYYKTGAINGTISDTAATTLSAVLVSDE